MATVHEINEGVEVEGGQTTGRSIHRIEIVGADRKVTGLVSFLPERDAQRPEFRMDEKLTDEEREAALDWLDMRWPGNNFIHPPDFFMMAQPKHARSVLRPGKLPPP